MTPLKNTLATVLTGIAITLATLPARAQVNSTGAQTTVFPQLAVTNLTGYTEAMSAPTNKLSTSPGIGGAYVKIPPNTAGGTLTINYTTGNAGTNTGVIGFDESTDLANWTTSQPISETLTAVGATNRYQISYTFSGTNWYGVAGLAWTYLSASGTNNIIVESASFSTWKQ